MTETDLIQKAMEFAVKAHGPQTYGYHHPYSKHLADVLEVAQKHWMPRIVLVAAPLHDVLEDTDVTYEQVKDLFGENVAALVQLVTNKPGKTRWDQHEATYPELSKSTNAIGLKLCDRIANVQFCVSEVGNHGKFQMYQKEHERFQYHLYRQGEWPALWKELNELFARGYWR